MIDAKVLAMKELLRRDNVDDGLNNPNVRAKTNSSLKKQ